jgi:hypothetical protein
VGGEVASKKTLSAKTLELWGPLETPIDQERHVIGFGLDGPIDADEIAARWPCFGRFLSAPHPHAYLKRLSDLDAM